MEIKLDKRTEANLKAFCKANGIEPTDYATTAVIERLGIDMYGDMNEMRKEPEPKKRATRKKAEPKPEVKKVEEEKKEAPTVVEVAEPTKVETTEPAVEEKPKRKRTLKVK